jgi:predicted transcriptional regulator of viral defense system
MERTLVDVLDRPDLAGGLEEVWRSLSSVPLFDLNVVVNYVRLCGQATLAAKVGFFLERRQAALGVPRTVLERLRRMRPKQPHYLDRKRGGRMAPGWNLMVPAPVLAGEWETIR